MFASLWRQEQSFWKVHERVFLSFISWRDEDDWLSKLLDGNAQIAWNDEIWKTETSEVFSRVKHCLKVYFNSGNLSFSVTKVFQTKNRNVRRKESMLETKFQITFLHPTTVLKLKNISTCETSRANASLIYHYLFFGSFKIFFLVCEHLEIHGLNKVGAFGLLYICLMLHNFWARNVRDSQTGQTTPNVPFRCFDL